MRRWFQRRGQQPKQLAELTPEELDTLLAEHPALEHLLRHSLGVMQFAPPRIAEQVLAQVEALVDEAVQRNLRPEDEEQLVLERLAQIQATLAGASPDEQSRS